MHKPRSCDTFAVLPPGTAENCVIFGKNSDRPGDEVQEVVYFPALDHTIPSTLKCTYIEVEQIPHTYANILSKPSWMWGAEMGANEHGVCIGNEAVWTKLNDDATDAEKKLLGMDLLRLGLERAKTALEALHVIVSLVQKYGMGGNCSDTLDDFTYHNSFLIADPSEVWILEVAGTIWAAEKITTGVRNISNELSIGTKIDLMSENLEEYAIEKGFWSADKGPLNFKLAFGLDDDDEESYRYKCGKKLLTQHSSNGQFKELDMFKVLRDKPSGICMASGSFVTTGSQVSVLKKEDSGIASSHWFNATPNPIRSVYKPFIFAKEIEFPPEVVSPTNKYAPVVDKRHHLYKMKQKCIDIYNSNSDCCIYTRRCHVDWMEKIEYLETKNVEIVKEITSNMDSKQVDAGRLFKCAVQEELDMYKWLRTAEGKHSDHMQNC